MESITRSGAASLAILSAAGLLMGVATFAQAAVIVTAGTATAIGGDTDVDSGVTFQFIDAASPSGAGTDNRIHVQLDLGSSTFVTEILNVNREDVATSLNALSAQILVASDESDPGFDPTDPTDYTVMVFNGQFSPVTAAAAAVRSADITDIGRRYFLIDYTDNFFNPIDGVVATDTDRVHVGDLQIVVPEPSLSGLLALGALVLRRRRQKQAL